MIGLTPEEFEALKKGPSKSPSRSASPSVIDTALSAEGVTGRAADFIRSIYQQESGGGTNTKTSNRGAVGGMQIIPSTFKLVANPDWDINDPVDNARAGVRYAMRQWNAARGNPAVAAAGYYGGDGGRIKAAQGIAVSDPKNPKAPTTLEYGQQVAARMGEPVAAAAPTKGPGVMTSAARGAVQGATAGWGDEMAGAGGMIGSAMNKTGINPAVMAVSVPVIGTTLGALMVLAGSKSKNESLADTYTRIRDSERGANAEAKEANPGTYGTTQILGTLLPAYLIKNPAALGAVTGGGNSDASSIGGLARDTAVGAAVGGAAGLGGRVLGAGVQKFGDKLGNEAAAAAVGPVKGVVSNVLGGAATGAVGGASVGASAAMASGHPENIPDWAWNGATGGAAYGALGGIKGSGTGALGNIINNAKQAGYSNAANVGSNIVNGGIGGAAKTAGSAVAAHVGSSEPARESGGDVLNWVKNVMGLDTPAGEQNMPQSFRDKIEADASAVRDGLKDGRPAPDVPNIVKENGVEYLVTPSGRKVQLN